MSWPDSAACRAMNPSRFFLQVLEPLARKTCQDCPVRLECQEAGLREPFGVWGGLGPSERRRVVEKRKRAA